MTVCHTVSLYIVSYSCNASFQIIREVILNQMEIMMPTEEKEKKNKYVNIKIFLLRLLRLLALTLLREAMLFPTQEITWKGQRWLFSVSLDFVSH